MRKDKQGTYLTPVFDGTAATELLFLCFFVQEHAIVAQPIARHIMTRIMTTINTTTPELDELLSWPVCIAQNNVIWKELE